jgi:uncharacterized membrane protein
MWWHDPWLVFGPLSVLILLAVVVGVMYFARRGARRRAVPLQILKERFARGELSPGEFEERRRILLN